MAPLTIFRQDLHPDDTVLDHETELFQSDVPANTPMGLRIVVILDRAHRNDKGTASLASVKTTPARQSTREVPSRKTLASTLSGMDKVAAKLQQRQYVDNKKGDGLSGALAATANVGPPNIEASSGIGDSHAAPSSVLVTTDASGYYGSSVKVAWQDPSEAQEDQIFAQAAEVYYFYNMDITEDHVNQIIDDLRIGPDDEYMAEILEQCEALRAKCEDSIWGDFISFRTGSHLSNVHDILYGSTDDDDNNRENPNIIDNRYAQLTEREKWNFWFSNYTLSTGLSLLKPLKSAIRREDILRDPEWGSYVRRVWTVACMSTWENHLQFDPQSERDSIDREQIRIDIREAAGRYCADRPLVGDVFVHFGGILDTGPVRSRKHAELEMEMEVDEEDPEWFDDERFGPPEGVI